MEQYLIAHKVRGEPAFDIAINIGSEENGDMWIIPTSGHRAYPYWYRPLVNTDAPPMPDDAIEHYQVSAAPKGKGSKTNGRDLLVQLGLAKPIEPFKRRSW